MVDLHLSVPLRSCRIAAGLSLALCTQLACTTAEEAAPTPSTGGASTASGGQPTDGVGEGGAASAAGGGSASGGTAGGQGDPGTEGNGIHEQPSPYASPPETTGRLGDAPEGSVSAAAFFEGSSVYPNFAFEYWVYVPAQYSPERPAALMVFQDGPHYLGITEAKFNSKNTFDNLIHTGDMPVTIGLFINPGTPDGTYDYPADTALRRAQYDVLDDKYARFIVDEIVPAVIQQNYNVVDDPDGWAIGGHSSGGIAAFTVAWHRPDKFRKVLTHNGSFVDIEGGDAYPDMIRNEPAKPLRVGLLSGSGDIAGWFEANDRMADALDEAGYAFRYLRGDGAHYPPTQAVADYPDALRWLWRAYTIPH